MLLLLSLLALVAAECTGNLVHNYATGVTTCVGNKRAISHQNRWSVTANQINTFDDWNAETVFSPIGRSPDGTATFGQAFTAPGTGERNLLTGLFSFVGTSNGIPISFTPEVYEFDSATATLGTLIWTGADIVIASSNTLFNKTIDFADQIAKTAPKLNAGTTYIILFSTTSTESGSVGRVTSSTYPGFLYISNGVGGLIKPNGASYSLVFTLTFEDVVNCVGSFIANPIWATSGGVPTNCLETACVNVNDAPAPGFLDEIYQITVQPSINGAACPFAQGTARNTEACTQINPCQNCVQTSSTSACVLITPPTCPAQTTTTFTTTTPFETSGTQTTLIPTPCQSTFTTACPCTDCVFTSSVGPCIQTACGNAAGTQVTTITVQAQPTGPGQACPATSTAACVASPVTPCVLPTE